MECVEMARRGRKRNLERERLYWDLLASGLDTVEACRQVGIGRRTGLRWRRENGGFRRDLGGVAPVQGRYLSLFERERIQTLTGQGVGVREITRRLERNPSTLSRELNRAECSGGGGAPYEAGAAHQHAAQLARRQRRSKLASDVWLHDFVQDKLELEWSPGQIAVHLRAAHPHRPNWHVCHETIYQALYHGGKGGLSRQLTRRLRTAGRCANAAAGPTNDGSGSSHRPG